MYHPLLFFVADHEHLKLSLSQIILFTNFYILLSCSTENAPFLLYVCVVAPTFPVPLGKNFTTQQTSSGLAFDPQWGGAFLHFCYYHNICEISVLYLFSFYFHSFINFPTIIIKIFYVQNGCSHFLNKCMLHSQETTIGFPVVILYTLPALRKTPINPSVPMKPLYWTRIVAQNTAAEEPSSALWTQIDELPLEDLHEFTDLFSRQVIVRTPTVKKEVKKTKVEAVKLLDSKRSQNVGILAQSLHVDFQEIENAVYNFDTSIVSLEALQQIYEVVSLIYAYIRFYCKTGSAPT